MIGTAIATSARILWRLLERRGIDPAPLFRDSGLDPGQLGKPRERYPVDRMCLAWTEASRLADDPGLGLGIVQVWQPTDFHALGCAFLASATLRDALSRLVRYHAVVNDLVSYSLVERGDHVALLCHTQYGNICEPPVLEDGRWAIVLDACRRIYGASLDPCMVSFRHAEPRSALGEFREFFRCPMHFDEPEACLAFQTDVIDSPLPASNRELALVQDRVLGEYLARLRRDSIVARTKSAISDNLTSGDLTHQAVANALHMTPRNLQRKLAAENTTFTALLEAVRKELAESYLADESLSLVDISYLLGFSERSSFSRAFKRWTGSTPHEFRDQELSHG